MVVRGVGETILMVVRLGAEEAATTTGGGRTFVTLGPEMGTRAGCREATFDAEELIAALSTLDEEASGAKLKGPSVLRFFSFAGLSENASMTTSLESLS